MPRKAGKPENSADHWSYEETVSTIEAVIGELESGQLPWPRCCLNLSRRFNLYSSVRRT
jgi:exonuclease VII small subunit